MLVQISLHVQLLGDGVALLDDAQHLPVGLARMTRP